MKRRLPFLFTWLIFMLVQVLTFFFGYQLSKLFNWYWIIVIFYLVVYFALEEVVARWGPKEEKFETSLAKFLRLSSREKTVLLIVAPLTFLVAFPFGLSLSPSWLGLLVTVASLIIGWVICRVLGGSRLGSFLLTGKLKDPSMRRVKSHTPKYKNPPSKIDEL